MYVANFCGTGRMPFSKKLNNLRFAVALHLPITTSVAFTRPCVSCLRWMGVLATMFGALRNLLNKS